MKFDALQLLKLSKLKRTDESDIAKFTEKEKKIFEFKKPPLLPRINWKNAKRYYIYGYAATTYENTKDNVIFSYECLNKMVHTNVYNSLPCNYNFNNDYLIGSGKLTGLQLDNKNNIYRVIANIVVVVNIEFARKINEMNCSLSVTDVSHVLQGNKRIITDCKVISLSLIDKKGTVDKYCTIFEILKDEDIDKRLEE